MKVLVVALSVALVIAAVSSSPQKYSSKYDNLNVDGIIANDRVLTSYINCILDKGPCTAEGREIRKRLPEALESGCEMCTDGQKKTMRKAIKHIMENRKAEWEQIKKKFDPKGEHSDLFKKFMDEE